MNRFRMLVFAGVLAVGGFGLGASSAQAQAPRGAAPASAPRYFYGWGYNGWGYYYYPAAPSVPTYSRGFYPAPSYRVSRPAGTRSSLPRDPTGRDVPLAKPWLRPLQ